MSQRLFFLLAACSLTLVVFALAVWRRPSRLLVLLTAFSLTASAQNWAPFLDRSRAVDWSQAGFTIPNYTSSCPTQPILTANSSSAASANSTAIENALNSCDSTHNVVNIPAGTWYVNGINFGSQGFQVLRGAGANSTKLISLGTAGCAGLGGSACMQAADWTYTGDPSVQPGGARACSWTAGYAQGTTSITLNSCGTVPTAWIGADLILDQGNDTSDTSGVYMCDGNTPNCTYEGSMNANGRLIGGILYSEEQIVHVTGVTALGGGAYTVTISPGVHATNIRSGKNPGAWYPGFVQNDGIENLTLDVTNAGGGNDGITMFSCYQCWAKGVAVLNGDRNSALIYQSKNSVIRDSYFYGAASHVSLSYNIEVDNSSDFLIENNIMQQVTTTVNLNGSTMGGVVDYNFSVDNIFADGSWTWGLYAGHATANNFTLWEGNVANKIVSDNASGPSDQFTVYRNLLSGKQPGTVNSTIPVLITAVSRDENVIGNILGTAGYHNIYQAYASSPSTFTNGGSENTSIYSLGSGGGAGCVLSPGSSTVCDPLVPQTLMRWGNYDTVTGGVKWDSTEASPAANTYVNANFTSTYFNSLAHTLPASLYYSSTPSWWPSGKAWPPIGPDVSTGNVGICSGGTYAGWQATNGSQCAGGTLSTAWASHATSIPAMDCYLNTMHGPTDGSGSALSFNASSCYSGSSTTGGTPASPTGLVATVN